MSILNIHNFTHEIQKITTLLKLTIEECKKDI